MEQEQGAVNEGNNTQSICRKVFNHLKGFFINLVKFLLALWTITDMALDVKSTHFYYQKSFNFN